MSKQAKTSFLAFMHSWNVVCATRREILLFHSHDSHKKSTQQQQIAFKTKFMSQERLIKLHQIAIDKAFLLFGDDDDEDDEVVSYFVMSFLSPLHKDLFCFWREYSLIHNFQIECV